VCQRVLRPFVSSEAELLAEVHRLRRKTQALVRQPRVWAAITYLAEALLRTPTLEGEALEGVLGVVKRLFEEDGLA
jgi:hypothetical protein